MTDDMTIQHTPMKRIFDILFSFTLLTLLFPFLALLMLLARLSSKSSPLYRHKRVGRGGKLFYCYKFRTMHKDADERLKKILSSRPDLAAEWNRSFKLKEDPRITPIGRFLRKYSLDELPQFFNVLKGDMSVAGPRPMVEEEVTSKLGSKAKKILSVRPGITGLWQVSGRSNTNYNERISLDEIYIEKRNLFFDLKLIFMTVPCLFISRGAY